MGKVLLKITVVAILFILASQQAAQAQCPCAYTNHNFWHEIDIERTGILDPSNTFFEHRIDSIPRRHAIPVRVCSGSDYRFLTCGGQIAPATSYNTILTVRTDSAGFPSSTVIGCNDNGGAGCGGVRSNIFVSGASLTLDTIVWVLLDNAACNTSTLPTPISTVRLRQLSYDTSRASNCLVPFKDSNCMAPDTTMQTINTSCAGNNWWAPDCLPGGGPDSLNLEDVVIKAETNDPALQYIRVFLDNCTAPRDSVYILIADTTTFGVVDRDSCLHNLCREWRFFDVDSTHGVHTGIFHESGTNDILIETNAQSPIWVVLDGPGNHNQSVSCDVKIEMYNSLSDFGLDTNGCVGATNDITACATASHCGGDTDNNGYSWGVQNVAAPAAGNRGTPVADTTFSAGSTYILCDTLWTTDPSGGDRRLKHVDLTLGSGWTSISVVSPAGGAPNGFYDTDANSVWTGTVTGQNVSFDFVSQGNGGLDGDDDPLTFFGGYDCAEYIFCVQATVSAAVLDSQELYIELMITQHNDDSINTAANINMERQTRLNTEFILPFRDLQLSAEASGDINLLDWSLYTDQEIEYFIVEKSSNAILFEEIGRVEGYPGVERTYYNFEDEEPFFGNNYYRIKQVYADDQIEYSKVVFVYNDKGLGGQLNLVNVFPNPTKGELNIETKDISETEYEINVYNIMGAWLKQVSYKTDGGGAYTHKVDLSDLATGLYAVQIKNTGNGAFETLLIQVD